MRRSLREKCAPVRRRTTTISQSGSTLIPCTNFTRTVTTHAGRHHNVGKTTPDPPAHVAHRFFTPRGPERRGHTPDPADVGKTIQVLTTRLPFLLKEGSLPQEILSEIITLELLPSTLGLPEIKGKTAYTTLVKLGTWSVTTLFPAATLMIDSQRLVGSARRCEKMSVRFRLVDESGATVYTGLFHFHFDANGKISRHIFEVVDEGYSPRQLVNWLVGARITEKNLGYCYERYDKK